MPQDRRSAPPLSSRIGSLADGRKGAARQRRLRRATLQNNLDLWEALALIRAAVEDCALPGSVANSEYLLPEPSHEAEAIVRGIYALAARER